MTYLALQIFQQTSLLFFQKRRGRRILFRVQLFEFLDLLTDLLEYALSIVVLTYSSARTKMRARSLPPLISDRVILVSGH